MAIIRLADKFSFYGIDCSMMACIALMQLHVALFLSWMASNERLSPCSRVFSTKYFSLKYMGQMSNNRIQGTSSSTTFTNGTLSSPLSLHWQTFSRNVSFFSMATLIHNAEHISSILLLDASMLPKLWSWHSLFSAHCVIWYYIFNVIKIRT